MEYQCVCYCINLFKVFKMSQKAFCLFLTCLCYHEKKMVKIWTMIFDLLCRKEPEEEQMESRRLWASHYNTRPHKCRIILSGSRASPNTGHYITVSSEGLLKQWSSFQCLNHIIVNILFKRIILALFPCTTLFQMHTWCIRDGIFFIIGLFFAIQYSLFWTVDKMFNEVKVLDYLVQC